MAAFPSLVHLVRQFIAFAGVGLATAVAHYGILVGLVEGAEVGPITATLAGYVAGGVVSYSLNRVHTYDSDRPHHEAGWRFALVALVGFLLTWLVMQGLVNGIGIDYLPAQLMTTGVVMVWSFLAHRIWTFAGSAPP